MSLSSTRERRANAGSRMRALLDQEADIEVLFEVTESDDEEFETQVEEEPDYVDSDFDLNSSEGEQEQEELGKAEDKQIEKEERQARRPATKIAHIVKPQRTEKQRKPQKTTQVNDDWLLPGKRQSSRSNTVRSRLYVEEQIRESKLRKAQLPKRDRPAVQQLTQEELLAEAAITERENRKSLEQWQQMEAERKTRAKKKDTKTMQGPFVRYRSFTDGHPDERPKQRKVIVIDQDNDGHNTQTEISDPAIVEWHLQHDILESDLVARNYVTFYSGETEETPVVVSGLNDRELDQVDLVPALAAWADRLPKPVKPILCPITGQPANYKDPKTKVPYANMGAYKVLQSCLAHHAIWSSTMGVYLGSSRAANGVPEGWDQMLCGKLEGQQDWQQPDGKVQRPQWLQERQANSQSSHLCAEQPHTSDIPH